jgi:hypothetical protein
LTSRLVDDRLPAITSLGNQPEGEHSLPEREGPNTTPCSPSGLFYSLTTEVCNLRMLTVIAIVLTLGLVAIDGGFSKNPKTCGNRVSHIQFARQQTQQLHRGMMRETYQVVHQERRTKSCAFLRWLHKEWKSRLHAAKVRYNNPPHKSEWLCIHSHEGSWNDHGAPYYGGLQMDLSFQRSYGRRLFNTKGTADNWTPLEQMWVAEKAYSSGRGFYPWPNTARYCGLL